MIMAKEQHPEVLRAERSLRLGGIGAGFIRICEDGRFRDVNIAAPKSASAAKVLPPDSFVALRAATSDGVAMRVLQSTLESAGANMPPPLGGLRWRCAYPAAHFQIEEAPFPLRVFWTLFSPIIPFDYEASSLPAFFSSIRLVNLTNDHVDAALVFNWDGASVLHSDISAIRVVATTIVTQENLTLSQVQAPPAMEQSGEMPAPEYNALIFSQESTEPEQIGDHACLAMRNNPAFRISLLQWDNRTPSAQEGFWTYIAEGVFAKGLRRQGALPRCGAIIAACSMRPGEEQRADFVLTWHCPSMERAYPETRGAYMARTRNAVETSQKSLRHVRYFFGAIEHWQQRLLNSTLPRWMRHALVDSIQAIASNADYARDGRFCLHSGGGGDHTKELDARIYGSLGLLLFFPRLEDVEIANRIKVVQKDHGRGENVERFAALVNTAYRDYVFTKNLARLQEFFPMLSRAMDEVLGGLRTGKHIPESLSSADAAGMWCVAVTAHALMARHLHYEDVTARGAAAYQRAIKEFERRFWSKDNQRYVAQDSEADPGYAGQLSAQWHADYLGLGNLLPHDRIMKTLQYAVSHPTAPRRPLWELQLACLLLYRGEMEKGLLHAESAWRRITLSAPHTTSMPTEAMAIWHVLYALEGLLYNAPDRHLRIAPHLPPGVEVLAAPIFTPSFLGQIRFEEASEGHYCQKIKVHLNSLVLLNSIELRTPKTFGDINARCVTSDGDAAISVRVIREDFGNRVLITPHKANAPGPLRLVLTEKPGNP